MKVRVKKIIKVFPNPWAATDHEGQPCGVCPSDPMETMGEPGRLVGVRHEAEFLNEVQKGELRNRRQRTTYRFLGETNCETKPHELAAKLVEKEPVTLAASSYYLERLRDRSLLPADTATAAMAGVKFEEPKTLFLELSKAAEKSFNDHFEEPDAYAQYVADRKEKADAAKAKAKAEAEAKAKAEKDAKKAGEASESSPKPAPKAANA